jgi:hypothetical protein
MRRSVTLLACATAVAAIAACGDDDDDANPKVGNGVNDVHQACVLRASWNRSAENCALCEAGVVSPECGCEALKGFSAACLDQANARKAACPDENLDVCVNNCPQADCDCVDRCYAGQDACKQASAARDGCIAEACAQHCK